MQNRCKPVDPVLIDAARRELSDAMATHKRPALQFSGGKDSLACLYLLRPYWDRLTVIWANAGDPYPETRELMDTVRPLVAAFHEVQGAAAMNGVIQAFPVDMLPIPSSPVGRAVEPHKNTFTLHSRYECCIHNFWQPMLEATRTLGVDLLIRGQRDSESKRAPFSSGAVDEIGTRYLLPLQHWSKEDVFAFLWAEGVDIPRQYAYGLPSLDCMHCTAYLDESGNKLKYLRDFHPGVAEEYERRLLLIHGEQEKQLRLTKIALGEIRSYRGEGLSD